VAPHAKNKIKSLKDKTFRDFSLITR